MEVKIATENDFKELLSLCDQFSTSPYYFDQDFVLLSENKIYPYFAEKMILSPYSTSILIKEKNSIVGFITVGVNTTISNLTNVKIGNIILLVIKPEFRGQGLGKFLINSGIKFLSSLGINLITVGTDIYNISAIRDYEECGFRFQLGWHIFRYFCNNFKIKDEEFSEQIEPLENPKILERFYNSFKRPLSILKDKNINSEIVRGYLFEQLIKNIYQNKIFSLCYKKNNTIYGVINFCYDELTEKTLLIEKRVIKIFDILTIDGIEEKEKIKSLMINDLKRKIFNTLLLEMWVNCEDQESIKTLEKNNFLLSYSGVYLHWKK